MTLSPEEKGLSGVSVTTVLPSAKAYVPPTAPLHRPKAQNASPFAIEEGSTGESNRTTIGVWTDAPGVCAGGATETTVSVRPAAAGAASAPLMNTTAVRPRAAWIRTG